MGGCVGVIAGLDCLYCSKLRSGKDKIFILVISDK
jgi:hypothetical protein